MPKSAVMVYLSFLFAAVQLVSITPSYAGTKKHTSTAVYKKSTAKVSSSTRSLSPKLAKSERRNLSTSRKLGAKSQRNAVASSRRNNVRNVGYQRASFSAPSVAPILSMGEQAGLNLTPDPLELNSSVALLVDQDSSEILLDKNSQIPLPIASLTKLMTSMVVLEAQQDMQEILRVTDEDVDREKHSSSRLRIGAELTRADMLHIALMSSENRAASALGRYYPGGLPAFVAAMNAKAKALGMNATHYVDSTGLSYLNVASARDLARLVIAAYRHPLIRQYSTDTRYVVEPGGRTVYYSTSNHLVENPEWQIGLQKTGYIHEAGRCMVMQTTIEGRKVIMVLLDSRGTYSRQADADRVRRWLAESQNSTDLTRIKADDPQS